MLKQIIGAFVFGFLALSGTAQAASLQVSPVNLEIPGAAAIINLRNEGDEPIQAQIRVLKWTQVNGKDELMPTRDVVASPPAAKIGPGADYVVRVVRIAKTPVQGEETYRILVDQLPKAASKTGTNVNFLMRYSIPVFFGTAASESPQVEWSAKLEGGKLVLRAANGGVRRLRISALKVHGPNGPLLNLGDGLAGYVLGGATNVMVSAKAPKGVAAGTALKVSAKTDAGPVQGAITIR